MKQLKKNILWVIYIVFVALAITFKPEEENFFISNGPYAIGKYIVWMMFFGFLAYSIQISNKENFFKSLKRLWPILWSRQIGLDLYLGLVVFMFILYLHEGSIIITLLWLIPVTLFANMATLLYLALHYDSLIAHFVV